MSMEFIRKAYDVPAHRGARIEYTDGKGCKFKGTIKSSKCGRLRIQLDKSPVRLNFHPTHNMRYL